MPNKLQELIDYHGHLCPDLIMGLRVSLAGLREVGPPTEGEELIAVLGAPGCAADAVQYLTGCTLGNGRLLLRSGDPFMFSFARQPDGPAVRVFVRPEALAPDDEEEQVLRRVRAGQGSPEDREACRVLLRRQALDVLDMAEQELLEVHSATDLRLPPRATTCPTAACQREMAPRLQLAAAPVTMLPIGIVHNELWPHEAPPRAKSERSLLEIYPPYVEALDDIGVHSHVQVLFVFDKASGGDRPLRQHRCGDPDQPLRGVFALRSPLRPNPIGLTEVELLEVREGELVVSGLDAWDGTPILDIKPYTPPSQSGGSES